MWDLFEMGAQQQPQPTAAVAKAERAPALKPSISHRRPSPLNCIEEGADREWLRLLPVTTGHCVSVSSFE